jgi:hypothetical protein
LKAGDRGLLVVGVEDVSIQPFIVTGKNLAKGLL